MRINSEGPVLVEPVTVPDASPERALSAQRAPPSSFERVVRGLGAAIDRGDRYVERAATTQYSGLDAGQLIALQAGIYRYSEAVDLTAKLVDRLTGAAKTVLEGGR
jgi:hypothetical protein